MEVEHGGVEAVDDDDGVGEEEHGGVGGVRDEGYHEGIVAEGVGGVAGEIEDEHIGGVQTVEGHADDIHVLVVVGIWKGEPFVRGAAEKAVGIEQFDLNWVRLEVHAPNI